MSKTKPYRLYYTDKDGVEQRLAIRSIERLEFIERNGASGRYEIRAKTGEMWTSRDVRALEIRGLWEVEWLEPGDTEYEGGWKIVALNDVGRNVIRKWAEHLAAQK
ncbi:hypothetical protein AB0M10_15125 [Streptomyces sp. NPDC051840]|uniref:hypothetical protein n=1 Tax=Streptomyces sp. NPDC051840 TaxID=3154752 RepID=UPI0034213DB8